MSLTIPDSHNHKRSHSHTHTQHRAPQRQLEATAPSHVRAHANGTAPSLRRPAAFPGPLRVPPPTAARRPPRARPPPRRLLAGRSFGSAPPNRFSAASVRTRRTSLVDRRNASPLPRRAPALWRRRRRVLARTRRPGAARDARPSPAVRAGASRARPSKRDPYLRDDRARARIAGLSLTTSDLGRARGLTSAGGSRTARPERGPHCARGAARAPLPHTGRARRRRPGLVTPPASKRTDGPDPSRP